MKHNERLFSALSSVDPDLIANATPRAHTAHTAPLKKWLPAAACFALAAIIGVAAWQMNTPDPIEDDKRQHEDHIYTKIESGHMEMVVDTNAATTEHELAIIPHWEDMTVSEQFGEFNVGEERYSTRVHTVDAGLIGEQLGTASSKGYDIYTDTMHETTLTYYAVQNLDPACVLAARFEGDDSYYVYVNSWYRPNTLGDLLDALNLRENMTFGNFSADGFNSDGNYEHVTFRDPDDSIVWEKLLSDPTLENVYNETGWYGSILSISVNIPLLGRNSAIWLTEDGHMVTNILDTGKAFYIGEEAVRDFLLYTILHCPDVESRVTIINRDHDEANTAHDGDIVEMTTQGYNPDAATTSRGANTPGYNPSAPETAVEGQTTAAPPYNPTVTMTSAAHTPETIPE